MIPLSNSSPTLYNPLEPIGIEKNGTFFDLFNSPNGAYKDFYVNESGFLISNSLDNIVALMGICAEISSNNYCINNLNTQNYNSTDNLTYSVLNKTYSAGGIVFQNKYSLNQTTEPVKIDFMIKGSIILLNSVNVSYRTYNLSLDNSNGSDTYIWVDGNFYSLIANQTISNITNKTLMIQGNGEKPFILMSWNDTAVVEIKGKEVYLKFLNINILPNQEIIIGSNLSRQALGD